MSDDFQPWRDRLAGKREGVDINTPEPGFYRIRAGKGGPWMPVAIWKKDGQLVCRVGATMRDPAEIWSFCHPVEKDAAKAAFETGKWPGDIDIGHNSGDLTLAEQIADTAEQAEAFHAAGLANGGTTCEDPPGWREGSVGKLYLAYVRDPDGNKLCALHRPPKA